MIFFGWIMETTNRAGEAVDWAPFVFGSIIAFAAYRIGSRVLNHPVLWVTAVLLIRFTALDVIRPWPEIARQAVATGARVQAYDPDLNPIRARMTTTATPPCTTPRAAPIRRWRRC